MPIEGVLTHRGHRREPCEEPGERKGPSQEARSPSSNPASLFPGCEGQLLPQLVCASVFPSLQCTQYQRTPQGNVSRLEQLLCKVLRAVPGTWHALNTTVRSFQP